MLIFLSVKGAQVKMHKIKYTAKVENIGKSTRKGNKWGKLKRSCPMNVQRRDSTFLYLPSLNLTMQNGNLTLVLAPRYKAAHVLLSVIVKPFVP